MKMQLVSISTKIYIILFSITIVINSDVLSAQTKTKVDSLYNLFSKSDRDKRSNILGDLLGEMNKVDTACAQSITEKLLKQTSNESDKNLYIQALLYDSRFGSFEKKIGRLNEAYKLAQLQNNVKLIGVAEENKGLLFKNYAIYDSAMTYTLKAKQIFEQLDEKYWLVSVLHTIADLHYFAELYDEAKVLYEKVLKLKGDPTAWNAWRKVVITNDLGSIEMHKKNYAGAISDFNNSVNYIFSRTGSLSQFDNTQLGYTYFLLARAYLLENTFAKADSYCSKSLKIAIRNKDYENQILLFVTKADILCNGSEYDSSMVFLKKAESLLEKYPDLETRIYLYEVYSKTFLGLKDYRMASSYQQKLIKAKDLNDKRLSETKFMNIYAENNYEKFNTEIKTFQMENTLLIIIVSFATIFFAVISFLFFKIRKSNLRLVGKSLELAKVERHEKTQHFSSDPVSITANKLDAEASLSLEQEPVLEKTSGEIREGEEQLESGFKTLSGEQLEALADKLNALVMNNKLFLKQDISMQQLSKLLDTNRSYLSRAINVEYGCNFHTYINNLRIKEAIRLITEGDHKLLTLEAIANEVGFNNRTSFMLAFKKYTGVSPSFFIKNLTAAKLD
ncbi:MAG: AraC family transcriptional regulator [Bacteroidota bacterium]